jgi:hypothetical protein
MLTSRCWCNLSKHLTGPVLKDGAWRALTRTSAACADKLEWTSRARDCADFTNNYYLTQPSWGLPKYLTSNLPTCSKKVLLAFRAGEADLNNDRGTFSQEVLCRLCDQSLESHYHLLMGCWHPQLNRLRATLYNNITSTPGVNRTAFLNLDSHSRMHIMLGRQNTTIVRSHAATIVSGLVADFILIITNLLPARPP